MNDTSTAEVRFETAIQRAATLVRAHVEALRTDLARNPYWNGDPSDDEAWRDGIDNAAGGVAGTYAALWTPSVADDLADWLEAADKAHPASWDSPECPQCDGGACEHPDVLGCDSCAEDYPCAMVAPAHRLALAILGETDAGQGALPVETVATQESAGVSR